MTESLRTVCLKNIALPVRVQHGNLSAAERIDDLDVRIDVLDIDVQVAFESSGPLAPTTMSGTWNYGSIYNHLCLKDVQTITGPLESVLDAALDLVEQSARAQDIQLASAAAFANRLGLAVGYPRLGVTRNFRQSKGLDHGTSRSAGICEYPLVISVDHSWCQGDQRVEHADTKTEAVLLRFSATTRARQLDATGLSGLYNYAGLMHEVAGMQGTRVTGPVEGLCDQVAAMLAQDAQKLGVDLLETHVEVQRTSYARCTPVLGLRTTYSS